MIFGLLSVVKNKACNIIAQIFVFVIRGVPMIVRLLCILLVFRICSIRFWVSETAFTLSALQAERYLPCLKLRRLYGLRSFVPASSLWISVRWRPEDLLVFHIGKL